MRLIWDYESGYVIDAESGEVVDMIFDYARDGEFGKYIGRRTEAERLADEGLKVLKKLRVRGLKDVRGTYVAYMLGLTTKTVKSLTRDEEVTVPQEYKEEFEHFLALIEKDPVLSVRPKRSKEVLALAASMVVRGKTLKEIAEELKLNEKSLRKSLQILISRI